MSDKSDKNESEKLISLFEVASFLNVTERTVYLWVQQGIIPGYKIGNSWRFRLSVVKEWLREHSNVQKAEEEEKEKKESEPEPHSRNVTNAEQIRECAEEMNRIWQESNEILWMVSDFIKSFVEEYNSEIAEYALQMLINSKSIRIVKKEVLPNKLVRFIGRV